MLCAPERRLFMPFGAARGVITRASAGGGAAAPTINGAESLIGVDSTGSPFGTHTISLSGQTHTAGDFLLALAGLRAQTVSSLAGATDDTYSSIASQSSTGAPFAHLAMLKGTLGGGALDASMSYTLSGGSRFAGGLVTISGAGANHDVVGTAQGTDASPASPDITTTVDQCLVLSLFAALGSHDLTTVQGAKPTGYDFVAAVRSFASTNAGNNSYITLGVASKVQETNGAVGAATWTSALGASMEWAAAQIAFPPA